MASMMRTDGIMADFRGLLRKFDDCPPKYDKGTIARGNEIVDNPYLSLIGNITPADLKPLAKKGTMLWGDGFLARFVLITPPGKEILRGRYPTGERVIPAHLTSPLCEWHKRLGSPNTQVVQRINDDGDPVTDGFEILNFPQFVVKIDTDVIDRTYIYLDALMDIAEASEITDLDGNLGRYHIKALRISLLFASLSNSDTITMEHWARAQEITERWRLYTTRGYEQVALAQDESEAYQNENKVVNLIKSKGARTIREIAQGTWGLDTAAIKEIVHNLESIGLLKQQKRGRTIEYVITNQ